MRLDREDREKFLSVAVATKDLAAKHGTAYMAGFEDGYYYTHDVESMDKEYFEEYEQGFTDGQVLAQEE